MGSNPISSVALFLMLRCPFSLGVSTRVFSLCFVLSACYFAMEKVKVFKNQKSKFKKKEMTTEDQLMIDIYPIRGIAYIRITSVYRRFRRDPRSY